MLTQQRDHEIVAIITEKIGVVPNSLNYDDNDRLINLELSNLALSQLPVELWQLTSLQELSLSYNQLSQLPPEIGQRYLLTPPPEITARGTADILSFLRELQESSTNRYEVKLLLVGEGGDW